LYAYSVDIKINSIFIQKEMVKGMRRIRVRWNHWLFNSTRIPIPFVLKPQGSVVLPFYPGQEPLSLSFLASHCEPFSVGAWRNSGNQVKARRTSYIVACITVGGSRNGPSFTINSIPKSEASTANSILIYINRYFVYRTSLALYIYR